MTRKLKVTAKIKSVETGEESTKEFIAVISDRDDLELLVQMNYGSFHDILEYTYEPIQVYVSTSYCCNVAAEILTSKRH